MADRLHINQNNQKQNSPTKEFCRWPAPIVVKRSLLGRSDEIQDTTGAIGQRIENLSRRNQRVFILFPLVPGGST